MNHDMDAEDGMVMTRIVIEHVVEEDGSDNVQMMAYDRQGELPPLIEMLGMLDLGRDTAYKMASGEGDEDE